MFGQIDLKNLNQILNFGKPQLNACHQFKHNRNRPTIWLHWRSPVAAKPSNQLIIRNC